MAKFEIINLANVSLDTINLSININGDNKNIIIGTGEWFIADGWLNEDGSWTIDGLWLDSKTINL